METRIEYKTRQYKNALFDFLKSLDIDLKIFPEIIKDTIKNGQAQKFEITVELLWKTVKVFLAEIHGFQENSPKTVIKKLYSLELIKAEEYEALIQIIENRNLLSHIYNEEQFQEIYVQIKKAPKIFLKVLSILESK